MKKLYVIIPEYKTPPNILEKNLSCLVKAVDGLVGLIIVQSGNCESSIKAINGQLVEVIAQQERLYAGAARNLGAKLAKADMLFFLDADCVPDEQWMEALRSAMKNLAASEAITGRVDWERFENTWTCALHLLEFHEFMSRRAFRPRFLASGNMLITRETFEKIGGFKEDWAACEDIGFLNAAHSKGLERLELFFDPELSVTHHATLKSREEILEKIDFMGFHRGLRDRDLSPELQVSGKVIVKYGSFLTGLAFLAAISWRSLRLKSVSLRELLILFPKLFVLCVAWAKAFHRGLRA